MQRRFLTRPTNQRTGPRNPNPQNRIATITLENISSGIKFAQEYK